MYYIHKILVKYLMSLKVILAENITGLSLNIIIFLKGAFMFVSHCDPLFNKTGN